jgi:hypothetical protein
MQYFYPLLVYTGLTGILLLLGIELIPNLKAWHKPMTAAWLSFLTLIWLFLPQDGQMGPLCMASLQCSGRADLAGNVA